MLNRVFIVSCTAMLLAGCAATDTRDQLLHAAQRSDPDFPDGEHVKLTHFAYIGRVQTPEGSVYIVEQNAVTMGMLAPRGHSDIQYFDRNLCWLGKDNLWFKPGSPLWTNGSLLFLHGGWPLPEDEQTELPDRILTGNAVDFSRGFVNRRVLSVESYGSSRNDGENVTASGVENPESRRLSAGPE